MSVLHTPTRLTRPLRALAARCRAASATSGHDSGQVLWLTIGYVLVAIALVTVVVSATSVHLERKRLLALADLAALDAADAIDADGYYQRGAGQGLALLGDAQVRGEVVDYLTAAAADSRLEDLTLVDVGTDGRTATVTLRSVARPPLVSWVIAPWSDGIELVVTASARAEPPG